MTEQEVIDVLIEELKENPNFSIEDSGFSCGSQSCISCKLYVNKCLAMGVTRLSEFYRVKLEFPEYFI